MNLASFRTYNRVSCFAVAASLTLSSCAGSNGSLSSRFAPALTAAATASCVAQKYSAPLAPAYAKTMWPSEKHDQWRTAAVAGGLPANVRKLRAQNAKLPPVPVWGYVGLDGNIYVLGGQPYLLDIYTKLILGSKESAQTLLAESLAYSNKVTPYVAKVDPTTLSTKILDLTQNHGVNYIGGMLVDSNGYLYAVARGVLYKIDPSSFTIKQSKRLPWAPDSSGKPNSLTSYNGMQATQDGSLILKGFASLGGGPGILLKVDPTDLSIEAKLESTTIAGARLAIATNAGQQYVYTAGATDSIRFLIGTDSFTLDNAFSQQYLYPSTGSTEGTSEVYMGNGVVFSNNTSPAATTPMTAFAQAARDGSTLFSQAAFTSTAKGWDWEMPSGDPYQTGIAAVQDQLSGSISGFQACSGGASLKKLWENDTIEDTIGLAINDKAGQLYADDRHCASKTCTLDLVVLNLKTGRLIARTSVAGTEPSIAQIFVGPNNAIYHLSTDTNRPNGYITRITAAP